MGLRGIGARPLSVRHPGLSEHMPAPVAPGWQTHAQRMWLLYGFDPKWADAFRDESEYRLAWSRDRETLMRECPPGRRPIGWWVLEGPCRYPGFDAEKMVLLEGGFLREDEVRELRRAGLIRADEKGAGANAAPATVPAEPATETATEIPRRRGRPPSDHALTSTERSRKHRERHAEKKWSNIGPPDASSAA